TLAERIADIGFGVARYADVPCGEFGYDPDEPHALEQRVTTDAAAAQAAVGRLRTTNGGDIPESGFESLYQVATGVGRVFDCASLTVPPFDPTAGLIPGVADGNIGGAGFRETDVRLVMQITDASSHARDAGYPHGASREEAFSALETSGLQVIGVALGTELFSFESDAMNDLEDTARRSGAVVDTCAWGVAGAGRPAACRAEQCCTGVDGAGRSSEGGQCPLVFQVATTLLGGDARVDTSVISGVQALLGGQVVDITAVPRRDEDEFAATGIDTTCFLQGVVPLSASGNGCASAPEPADTDGDGRLDGFRNVSPGSTVTFEVRAQNNCVQEGADPVTFLAWIDLFTEDGDSLGSRSVTILVPAIPPKL
ncbi:MAG: hypothetical protein ACI81R_003088, partial [Bradymonadia bacterium]